MSYFLLNSIIFGRYKCLIMKKKLLKILFFAPFALLFSKINAQEVFIIGNLNYDSTHIASAPSDTFSIEKKIYLYHNSSSQVKIVWDATGFTSTPGWGVNLCEDVRAGGACYQLSFKSGDTMTADVGDTLYLKPQFLPNGIAGFGYIPITIELDGVSGSLKQYHYYFKVDSLVEVTSINEITNLNFKLYPNPAVEVVNIDLPSNHNVKTIKVYNVLGKEVYQTIVNSNPTVKIETKNYKSGVYIVKLIDKHNNISTSTFIVK